MKSGNKLKFYTKRPNQCVGITDIYPKQHDDMTTSTTTTLSPPVTRPPGGCVTSDGRKIAEGDVVEKVDQIIN